MLLRRGNTYDQQDEIQNVFTKIKSHYDDQIAFLAKKVVFFPGRRKHNKSTLAFNVAQPAAM